MTGKAASGWAGILLTAVVLLVGATVYVSGFATHADILHEVESHSDSTHKSTERAMDRVREQMVREHKDLKDFIREIHR